VILAAPGTGSGESLTPWEIIEAARAHLAEQRKADSPAPPQPATTAWPASEPHPSAPSSNPGAAPTSIPGAPAGTGPAAPTSYPGAPASSGPAAGAGVPGPSREPGVASPAGTPYEGSSVGPTAVTPDPTSPFFTAPPTALTPDPAAPLTSVSPGDPPAGASTPPALPDSADYRPDPGPELVEAHGITFLPGPDDIERLLTELRRRGTWALSLRGQEVSSASAPAVLLVGELSCGQRRLTRMIARALAEVGVGSGEVHTLLTDELAEIDPRRLRERIAEYGGHTLLIEGLDTIVLDDDRGAAYASALYRARVEGVSETILAATCAPGRLRELTDAIPELITDFRTIRLPDLSDPRLRVHLAALLAGERRLKLAPEAWQVARRDLESLRGRGRLTNARLVEAYLDRACNHHLGQAGETQVFQGQNTLTLSMEDFQGVAAELEP
jgi:hypothetical protein